MWRSSARSAPRSASGSPARTTRRIVTYERWDVVVVPFPFADRVASRRRPALVVSEADPLGTVVGHHVLAMITSAAHTRWPLDVPVGDLDAAGLPAPSL